MRTANWFTVFLITSVSYLFFSCHFNSTFINREQDKDDAEKITNQFYDFLKANQYSKTYSLFSKSFFEVTDTTKLKSMYITMDEKLGSIENVSLDKWETKIVRGTDAKSIYVLQYFVKRENFDSKETITLTKENDQIKIYRYKVNSDGFITPENK